MPSTVLLCATPLTPGGNMRSTFCAACLVFGVMLVSSPSARGDLTRGMRDGSVSDVGPEAGLVFGNVIQPFLFRSRQEVLVTSGRAGIYRTLNGGQSWQRSERGLVDASGVEPYAAGLCQAPSAPEIAYLISLRDEVSRTADFGENWEPLTHLPNPQLADCAVDPGDPSVVYVLAAFSDSLHPGVIFKSTDSGQSFFTVGAGLPQIDSAITLAVAPTNPQTVYLTGFSGSSGGLYVSSDAGLNFHVLPNAPPPSLVYPHPTDDGTLFVTGGGLFLSTDGGETFAQVGAGLPRSGHIAFDPTDASIMYSSAGVDGLFRSSDGGLTFEHLGGLGEELLLGLGAIDVGVSPGTSEDPPVVYAGTSRGPVRSDDGGETFASIHAGYRGTQVNDVAIDAKGRLLVATINSVGAFRSTGPGVYQIIGATLPRDIATSLSTVAASPDDPELYLVTGSTGAY